jgi:hypothetical protein
VAAETRRTWCFPFGMGMDRSSIVDEKYRDKRGEKKHTKDRVWDYLYASYVCAEVMLVRSKIV